MLRVMNIHLLNSQHFYRFISSSESFTGQPLLLVAGTTSGTLVMYEVVNEADESSGNGMNGGK